jgi:diguanylate cyclase (GGDEF)-like protein
MSGGRRRDGGTEQRGDSLGDASKAAEQPASHVDQRPSNGDHSTAGAPQTSWGADEAGSRRDQESADDDQRASDRDQATADRDHAAAAGPAGADESAYATSRDERAKGSFARLGTRIERAITARTRNNTASRGNRTGDAPDKPARGNDVPVVAEPPASEGLHEALMKHLEWIRAQAAVDRVRDARAAEIALAEAARERARLEAELRSAHLDDLTGTYRRDMGRLAIAHEINRARRSDGQFVLAFVDVDDLKGVNERDGHAAGDRVLQIVARTIRNGLHAFDPIIRYGGDEFVCGVGGTNLAEARQRFDAIGSAIRTAARVGISVGLAELRVGETPDHLTERADAAMFEVKAEHSAMKTRVST